MTYNKKYRFGGVVFEINAPCSLKEKLIFEAFAENHTDPDFVYDIINDESVYDAPVRCERDGNRIKAYMNAQLIKGITVANFLGSANAAHLLPEKGAFILHASNITVNGEAILFTAPSGTGKSTQAHYWRDERGAGLVNEDRAIVFLKDGKYYAAGCWAMGSGDVCRNVTAPIRAIVILSQGKENVVAKPGSAELLSKIVPQCSFDDKSITGRIQIIEAVSKMIGNVNIVSFACRNEKEAVSELEKYI